jgi:hypothetical protein
MLLKSDPIAAHDPGLQSWVGHLETLEFGKRIVNFSSNTVDEYFQATRGGLVTFLGYPPTNTSSFCSTLPSETPQTGYYHWSLRKTILTIRRLRFDACPDRATIMAGTWTKSS